VDGHWLAISGGATLGQASRRGSFEQRKALAIQREQERLDAIEEKRRLRYRQECAAHDTMVWWQIEMSERRYDHIARRKTKDQMMLAQLFGMAYGAGWGGLGAMYY
jgi:hypothetical protein